MAINYASQFAPKVAETFATESITDSACGREYQFTGSKSVKVLTVDTVPLNDYNRSGVNRYGEPVELGDTYQEMIMKDDKAFTMTIDKGNNADQMNLKGAAEAMKREIAQVVAPYVDKYRLNVWSKNSGLLVSINDEKTDMLKAVFSAGAAMDNAGVPLTDRTLFIRNTSYQYLAMSDKLIGCQQLGQQILSKGIVGELNGMVVKRVPDNYFPEAVFGVVKWKNASADPVKLQEGKIHKDPPGLSGNLLEGRIYQDSFVLRSKMNGICTLASGLKMSVKPIISVNSSNGQVSISCGTGSTYIMYTTDGSDPRYSETAKKYANAFTVPKGTVVKACSFVYNIDLTLGVVEKVVTW